jgi:ABC-type spermidine/putrescine transport system permease subunit I
MAGIKTGVFLVFVPAFGEFVIPAIIGGAHHLFVGSLISHYFLVARDSQVGAAFTMVSGLVLLVCALLFNWLCVVPLQKIQKKDPVA